MRRKTFLFCAAFFLFLACTAPAPSAPKPPSTDLATLEKLIPLPKGVKNVLWKSKTLSEPGLGPTDWTLDALIDFESGALAKILPAIPTLGGASDLTTFTFPDWVPRTSDKVLFRDAALFIRSPLLQGFAVRIGEGDRLFIHLYTK